MLLDETAREVYGSAANLFQTVEDAGNGILPGSVPEMVAFVAAHVRPDIMCYVNKDGVAHRTMLILRPGDEWGEGLWLCDCERFAHWFWCGHCTDANERMDVLQNPGDDDHDPEYRRHVEACVTVVVTCAGWGV